MSVLRQLVPEPVPDASMATLDSEISILDGHALIEYSFEEL
jgi:hypothetical protein